MLRAQLLAYFVRFVNFGFTGDFTNLVKRNLSKNVFLILALDKIYLSKG